MADLSKIGERDALKSRKGDEPHWQRLRHGCYVGFRPSKRGGRGTWFARAYDPDKCKYSRKALGDYGSLIGHEIYSQARKDAETFYWIAIVFSNSLGTAFGDWLTDNAGLSYVQGALVTAAVIGVVVALHYGTRISHVLLFWIAFIFTRPFGATFGDLLTKPLDHGGFNLPRGTASLITLALLAGVLVVSEYLSRRNDSRNDPGTIERLEARAGE